MQEARNYTRWLLERFAPYLGDDVLEIGAGIGAYTVPLLHAGKRISACEASSDAASVLRRRAGSTQSLEIIVGEFPTDRVETELGAARFDSVLCVNVLEHVDDPEGLIAAAYQRLRVGGRLLLLVPAVAAAYGEIDRNLGHRRRFSRKELQELLGAPWTVEILQYTNLVGLLGWMLNAHLFKRARQSVGQILVFDRAVVPFLRVVERRIAAPIGQSLLAVVRK
jgi:SAM-dependent methyltransferase